MCFDIFQHAQWRFPCVDVTRVGHRCIGLCIALKQQRVLKAPSLFTMGLQKWLYVTLQGPL